MPKKVEMDLSSFMSIIIMAIGCLVVILVVNMVIIVSNPDNVEIMSIVRGAYEEYTEEGKQGEYVGLPIYANKLKDMFYIDVQPDRIILYPEKQEIMLNDLERAGNAFEKRLDLIEPLKDRIYMVLVLRPRTSRVTKMIRRAILDRGIDVGHELYEANRKIPDGIKAPDVEMIRAELGLASAQSSSDTNVPPTAETSAPAGEQTAETIAQPVEPLPAEAAAQ